jgi:hypothetical protein
VSSGHHYSIITSFPTIMASGSNPQQTRQRVRDNDRVDSSTSQRGTTSSTRLANIPKQAVEKVSKYLRQIIFPKGDDEILDVLQVVRTLVKGALEQDPKLKEHLASEEEFRENVTRKGERKFIDSLRAAANSDGQGSLSKAWEDLLQDGTFFSLGPSVLILFSG